MRRRRHRRGAPRPSDQRLAGLERALLGDDPRLSPERAADELAHSRRGALLLKRVVQLHESDRVREAAVYGFAWGDQVRSAERNLLLRIFTDPTEPGSLRGQAAEALAGRVQFQKRRGRWRRRDVLARSAFVQGLDDDAPEVRLWSIFALVHEGNEWVVPKLQSMIADTAMVPGMWTVSQEAQWGIDCLLKRADARDDIRSYPVPGTPNPPEDVS